MESKNQIPTSQNNLYMGIAIGTVAIVLVVSIIYFAKKKTTSQKPQTTEMAQQKVQGGDAKVAPGKEPMTPPVMTDVQNTEMENGTATTSTQKTFHIVGGNFFFVPNEVKVNKGDTVTIIFDNAGGLHDFVIDEMNARTKRIQTNGEDTVTFTADKTGSFEFYCSVGQHRQMGMKGMLIVQ